MNKKFKKKIVYESQYGRIGEPFPPILETEPNFFSLILISKHIKV